MAGETTITVIGNLTADPELRFTPAGAAVANFTIASTPRNFDRDSNQFKDGETLFMRCSLWREAAENMVESLKKGDRVIAEGFLKQRSYDKDGDKRTVIEMEVQELGASVKYAKLGGISKADPSGRTPQPQNGYQQAPQQGGYQQQAPAQGGYQQAPQQGAQSGWNQNAAQQAVTQQAQGGDPWATPGVSNPGGGQQWGNGGPGF